LHDDNFQTETDTLWERLDALWREQFIDSMSPAGLARWEEMMALAPAGDLEARRRAVQARLIEEPPFTIGSLREALVKLCGGAEAVIAAGSFNLRVRVRAGTSMALARAMLDRWLPANIALDFGELLNTHQHLRVRRHRELAAKTHRQIKETEV
jgi:hypothetical protein